MGDLNRIKGKVALEVDGETNQALQKHFFKRVSGETAISCGSPILDSYAPASTVQGCNRIANGDGMLSSADLFVHYIFKERIVPRQLRRHVVPDPNLYEDSATYGGGYKTRISDSVVFAGISVLRSLLKSFGLVYNGSPELRCVAFTNDPRLRGKRCFWYSSAAFLASDIKGSGNNYRQFSSTDRIYSDDIMRRLERYVIDRIFPNRRDQSEGGLVGPFFPGAENDG